jgi:2-hydroxycyclohexanecarboxyl-CoA dehydrogenase
MRGEIVTTSATPHPDRKVIVLAGAAHGIGRAIALRAAAGGHALALCDIDKAGLGALRADLPADCDAMLSAVDVVSHEAVHDFAASVVERFGRIDSAICNAGGMISLVHDGKVAKNIRTFLEIPPADWKSIVDLNLFGVLNLTHAVLPQMIAQGHGRIVMLASVSGLVGNAGLSVYAAAKGGVISFAKSMARELGDSGVSVNCVAPGGVATRAFPTGSASIAKRLEGMSVKRLGEPDEIANVVMYLASEAPAFLTGEVVAVSGGPP